MRIALSYLGVAVVLTALGCQPKSDNMTSGEAVTEPSTVVQAEPNMPLNSPEPESTATNDAEHAESEDHEQGAGGMLGHGPGGMGRGMGRGMGGGMGRGPAQWEKCERT